MHGIDSHCILFICLLYIISDVNVDIKTLDLRLDGKFFVSFITHARGTTARSTYGTCKQYIFLVVNKKDEDDDNNVRSSKLTEDEKIPGDERSIK